MIINMRVKEKLNSFHLIQYMTLHFNHFLCRKQSNAIKIKYLHYFFIKSFIRIIRIIIFIILLGHFYNITCDLLRRDRNLNITYYKLSLRYINYSIV